MFGEDKLLGIDIGSKNIKIIELKKSHNQTAELLNYAFANLQQSNARQLANKQVADILRVVMEKAEIKTEDVIMSLPAFASFMTIAQFPNMPKNELANAIKFEAQKYIPIPLKEVSLGWHRLSGADVLLIAVPKKLTDKYGEIAKMSGLRLKGLESETFALARALADSSLICLLIDFGAHSTNLSLSEKGFVKFNRTIDVTSPNAYKEISTVVQAIRQILQKYAIINKIIISGGADLNLIQGSLSQQTNLPIEIADPWKNIVYSKKYGKAIAKPIKELSRYLGVAIGLALRVRE